MKFVKDFKEKNIRGSKLKTVGKLIQYHLDSCTDTLAQIDIPRMNSKKEGLILFLEFEKKGYEVIQSDLTEMSNDFSVTLFRGSKVSKMCKVLHRELENQKENIRFFSKNPNTDYYSSLGLSKAYRTALHILVAVFNVRVYDLKDRDIDEAIEAKILLNTLSDHEED